MSVESTNYMKLRQGVSISAAIVCQKIKDGLAPQIYQERIQYYRTEFEKQLCLIIAGHLNITVVRNQKLIGSDIVIDIIVEKLAFVISKIDGNRYQTQQYIDLFGMNYVKALANLPGIVVTFTHDGGYIIEDH